LKKDHLIAVTVLASVKLLHRIIFAHEYSGRTEHISGNRHIIYVIFFDCILTDNFTLGEKMNIRVGQGLDVHKLVSGRPLVLGGVVVPFDKGLEGHSDADVLVHAICDALLGAACLGDIGQHFPDTDPAFQNSDSLVLLAGVAGMLAEKGYTVGNIDTVIIAEKPKIAPYRKEMQATIARVLKIDPEQVSLKATTTEKLGMFGREEGIGALCTALIQKV
jgi:2-C-methyl-D-erythritol 2,4-cyclodiphosphate synthase